MSKEKLIVENEFIEVESLPFNVKNGATYVIKQPNPNSFTHSFFKYPCKFIPEIPRWAIGKYLDNKNQKVIDPFSGSGTTLLEAIIEGHQAYGTEIDNFAKLLIKVKTTPLDVKEVEFIINWLDRLYKYQECFGSYQSPFIPNINNLYHWFTEENALKLGIIKSEINKISKEKIVDFLNVCFASSIRRSSNADEVSPKPYVSRRIIKTPPDPFKEFINITNRYIKAMIELIDYNVSNPFQETKIVEGDALNIKTNISMDIAITSPPYINAFDYGRTLRLENLWLGLESEESIRKKKREYVGTENINIKNNDDLSILDLSEDLKRIYYKIEPLDKKRAIIVKTFFEDMKANLKQLYKLLKKDGRYVIVIGNSTIRKVNIESWSIIYEIAKTVGFELDMYFGYVIQNHYLRIPRGTRGGKIKKDYVLVLKKVI